jgi:hypothetical protein
MGSCYDASMKRVLVVFLLAAACGSSPPPTTTPPPPPPTSAGSASSGMLGLGEIVVKDGAQEMLAVHPNGQVQINDGGTWKPIATLSTDGKMVTADGKAGQLQADGTFVTPEGPVPFKLDGPALVAGSTRLTIENGKLVGGNDTAKSVTITGAETDGTKRTTLLIIGLLMTAQRAEATPPTATTPATPAAK